MVGHCGGGLYVRALVWYFVSAKLFGHCAVSDVHRAALRLDRAGRCHSRFDGVFKWKKEPLMSNMLELFLPKAWLVAHQAGNNDNLRLAMAEIVKKGEHSLQVGPVSEERNNGTP